METDILEISPVEEYIGMLPEITVRKSLPKIDSDIYYDTKYRQEEQERKEKILLRKILEDSMAVVQELEDRVNYLNRQFYDLFLEEGLDGFLFNPNSFVTVKPTETIPYRKKSKLAWDRCEFRWLYQIRFNFNNIKWSDEDNIKDKIGNSNNPKHRSITLLNDIKRIGTSFHNTKIIAITIYPIGFQTMPEAKKIEQKAFELLEKYGVERTPWICEDLWGSGLKRTAFDGSTELFMPKDITFDILEEVSLANILNIEFEKTPNSWIIIK
jgi:hypothetical protein